MWRAVLEAETRKPEQFYQSMSLSDKQFNFEKVYLSLDASLVSFNDKLKRIVKDLIYQFIVQQKLAVVSTANSNDKPEAALVGIAVSTNMEIIFDTVKTSRKYQNILRNPDVAMVIGWDNEITVQYEGQAMVLGDDKEADNMKEIYYRTFPEGRERTDTWPGLVHIKIIPRWVRYSNFNEPQLIHELSF